MSDEDAAEFLSSYGLKESGLVRLIRKTYELLGLISFFTVGEDECRAWTVERGSKAVNAAGAIHTDLSNITSFAPRPFTGTSCWKPAPKPRPAPAAPCAWKARSTS